MSKSCLRIKWNLSLNKKKEEYLENDIFDKEIVFFLSHMSQEETLNLFYLKKCHEITSAGILHHMNEVFYHCSSNKSEVLQFMTSVAKCPEPLHSFAHKK